jgi:cellulose synthase/poly-beta-1,6-N-acetylglucosamine synthase-like glycosyltransferase
MTLLGVILVTVPVALFIYSYVGYPALLWLMARNRDPELPSGDPEKWPELTITLPVYNEERAIAATLDSLLALDYPAEQRHVLVVSDASTDRTDEIVREYADRGVELLRLSARGGKTAAENAAGTRIRGSIAVNTDATIRILPGSLKPLIRVFQNPAVGVASGRDLSVGVADREGNRGESSYVDYEMWVRSLETRMGSIVGASGCFYAMRRDLLDVLFPEALSRDFASALIAVERGYRAVSVGAAVCLVPRTRSLSSEYRRKVRTMARGLETLWFKRHLMLRKGNRGFGYRLASHKLIRWLVFLTAPMAPIGLALLAVEHPVARWALGGCAVGLAAAGLAFLWPKDRAVPRLLALAGFAVGAHVAGFVAWTRALRGELNPIWEPTRRG